MKKFALVLILMLCVSAGSVFADHPHGWGIGVGSLGNSGFGASVLLKAPQLPIYWGINLDMFNSNWFGIGLTGDFYIMDQTLVPGINLGWFLGVGGFFNYFTYDYGFSYLNYTALNFGARVPVGIYIIPLPFLELFLDIAPSLGFYTYTYGSDFTGTRSSGMTPTFTFPIELGLRFWL